MWYHLPGPSPFQNQPLLDLSLAAAAMNNTHCPACQISLVLGDILIFYVAKSPNWVCGAVRCFSGNPQLFLVLVKSSLFFSRNMLFIIFFLRIHISYLTEAQCSSRNPSIIYPPLLTNITMESHHVYHV